MLCGKWFAGGAALTLCSLIAWGTGVAGGQSAGSVPIETVADYIHGVLESDRTFYTVHVVERMQQSGAIASSEQWRAGKTLPLPAQFFQESSNLAVLTGVKVRYRLIGLHPINKLNGPANEFERKALEAVMAHPEQPYKGVVKEGNARYFQAVYADLAVSPVCVSCHNADPRSSKHDYELHDVLGGVAISIPMPE
jgi:hypothetical protein